MATQQFIIDCEQDICSLDDLLNDVEEAVELEALDKAGHIDNRVLWATLSVNLAQLIRRAKITLKKVTDHTGKAGFNFESLENLLK